MAARRRGALKLAGHALADLRRARELQVRAEAEMIAQLDVLGVADVYALTGRFMTDWEEFPHQQSKLRVTRQAELRYISFADAEPGGKRHRGDQPGETCGAC